MIICVVYNIVLGYKLAGLFDSLWVSMKSVSVIIQIKDTEHEYFPVVLVIMPYNVVLTFESMNEIQREPPI